MDKSTAKFNKMSARFGSERTAAVLEDYRTGRGASINRLHNFFYRKFSKEKTKIINSGAETLAHLEVLKTSDDVGKQKSTVNALLEIYCQSTVVKLLREAVGKDKTIVLLEKVFDKAEVRDLVAWSIG